MMHPVTSQLEKDLLQFLISMHRGKLIWYPSGIREDFSILVKKKANLMKGDDQKIYSSRYSVHWFNQEGEQLGKPLRPDLITVLLKRKLLRRVKVPVHFNFMGTPYTHSLVLHKTNLKKHPKYTEIRVQAAVM